MNLSVLNNENGKVRENKKKESSLLKAETIPGFCFEAQQKEESLNVNTDMIISDCMGKLKTSPWFLLLLGFICNCYKGCVWKMGTCIKRTTKKK